MLDNHGVFDSNKKSTGPEKNSGVLRSKSLQYTDRGP